VVDCMDRYTDGWGRVKAAVGTLRAVAEAPLGRVCFSTGQVPNLDAFGALTLVQFHSLPLPEGAIDPLRYTQPNRMAVAIVHAMTAMANRIVDVGTPEDPKLLIYDEAKPILENPEGRASLERFTLQGRSKGIVPVILSQNSSHLVGETLRNNLGTAFVFELPSAKEAEHACGLLGIEATEQNVHLIQTLSPRQGDGTRPDYAICVMRDSEGRVGMMQPDLQTDEIKRAFDTTPGSRFGLQVVAEATGA
jgi:AAA domain-containing protein